MFYLCGPATITHGGSDLGKTYGGGTLRLLHKDKAEVSNDYDPTPVVYGGEGTFRFYKWSGVTIGSDLELYAFGEVVITTTNATITLYKCKILLNLDNMTLGTNEQQPINVRLIFTPNDSGNIINIA
jgi:hypothetical protein